MRPRPYLSTLPLLWASIAVLAPLTLVTPALVQGQEASPADAIREIREEVLYAQYGEAVAGLEAYLARTDIDARQRNAGLEVLATIQIARRHRRRTRQTLSLLYARDPAHPLNESDPSPPVLSAFGRARENAPEPMPVVLDHAAPSFTSRVPPTIEVTIGGEGADAVQEVRLRYHQERSGAFSTVVMDKEGQVATARIPLLDEQSAYDVEYIIEATAPSGALLSSLGTEDTPLTFAVPAETPANTFDLAAGSEGSSVDDTDGGSLVWLWITLGVAIVAGGVAVAVVFATQGGPDDGSLGNIDLPLVTF